MSARRIAYVQCSAGVAGDMLLGALVDAGADREAVFAAVGGLGVDGYSLTFDRVQRCGVAATWANVAVDDARTTTSTARPRQMHKLLDAADLPDGVRRRAQSVFGTLASAEGAVHGIDPDDVEFHEVGAVDAIVDVVGICAALEALGVDELVAGPIANGPRDGHDRPRGAAQPGAGRGPTPRHAPGSGRRGGHRPRAGDTDWGRRPCRPGDLVRASASDVGVGGRFRRRACRHGRAAQRRAGDRRHGSGRRRSRRSRDAHAVQVDVNVDDVSGEVIAHTIGALIGAGAFDAWATPIVMKKGRPAHVVSALCDPALVETVASILVAETGSLGVRATTVERWPQQRRESSVDVGGHRIAVKLGAGRVKVEHDDAVAAAQALGRPLREVLAEAERLGTDLDVDPRSSAGVTPGRRRALRRGGRRRRSGPHPRAAGGRVRRRR